LSIEIAVGCWLLAVGSHAIGPGSELKDDGYFAED